MDHRPSVEVAEADGNPDRRVLVVRQAGEAAAAGVVPQVNLAPQPQHDQLGEH